MTAARSREHRPVRTMWKIRQEFESISLSAVGVNKWRQNRQTLACHFTI